MSFGAKIITTNHQRRKKKDEKMMKNRTTQMINRLTLALITAHTLTES